MAVYEKQLKVGKKERYTLGLSAWLNGETITSATVTACGSFLTVDSYDFTGDVIGFFATGVARGAPEVIFSYTTATRNDSQKHNVVVVAADACKVT